MIVKCNKIISPITKDDLGDKSPWLTKGKTYIVLAMNVSSKWGIEICIQTDHYNEPRYITLNGFEIITQHIPSSWVTQCKRIEDVMFFEMLPKSWTQDGFFEKIDNENLEAITLFNKEAEFIYKEENNR